MNGYLDDDPNKGKVSYLGGHKYTTDLPISANPETQGVRYFLNSLFEAPCTSTDGLPTVSTEPQGPGGTNDSRYTVSARYDNAGPGVAFNAVLTLVLPAGVTFVSASDGGVLVGDTVVWDLGSLLTGASGSPTVTVDFPAWGSYSFSTLLDYDVGQNPYQVPGDAPLAVTFSSVNLLRYGGVSARSPLTPSADQIFVAQYPVDPALDPARDLEAVAFTSGAGFPSDVSDLLPGSPPLVFYELESQTGETLRVTKAGGKIVITY
jgi:uncharacterized repeat protein (TIGR01451 family)